jgi:hypothetical protein
MCKLIKLVTLSLIATTLSWTSMPNAAATGTRPIEQIPTFPEQVSNRNHEGTLIARRIPRARARIVCQTRRYRHNGRVIARRVCLLVR